MRGSVWSVFVAAMLLVAVFSLSVAHGDALHTYTEDNESIQVDYSQQVSVDVNASEYKDDERVWNNSNYELSEGSDYEWNETSGNVTWINSSHTSDGETASITYTYRNQSETTNTTTSILQSIMVPVLGLILLIAGAGAVMSMINITGSGW